MKNLHLAPKKIKKICQIENMEVKSLLKGSILKRRKERNQRNEFESRLANDNFIHKGYTAIVNDKAQIIGFSRYPDTQIYLGKYITKKYLSLNIFQNKSAIYMT